MTKSTTARRQLTSLAAVRCATHSHPTGYNATMQYRLRTLLAFLTLGPPALSWAWLHGREKDHWGYILAAFLFGVAVSLVILVWQGWLHASILEDRQR